MSRKTFSLVGAGRMGQNHLRVAQNLGLEVTAVYDLNTESLEAASRLLSSPAFLTSDFDEFIQSSPTDITAIATTCPSHSDLIKSLAEAGRKILICEKPLAASIQELDQIAEQTRKFDLRVAVNHQMRFMDQYRIVKAMQNEHQLGKLCTMSVNGANFGLGMNATHYVEAFHWLSNSELSTVSGTVSKQKQANIRGSEFYDYAGFMLVQSQSGSLLFLDFQESISHQVIVLYNFQFGKICVNELNGTVTLDSRCIEDLKEPPFRYGMPNHHLEFKIKPAELIDSTAELYSQVLLDGDYPTHFNGERTVRSALAGILSTHLNGIPIELDDIRLETIGKLSWP